MPILTTSGWNKKVPAPELPPEVVAKTQEKFAEALRRLAATMTSRISITNLSPEARAYLQAVSVDAHAKASVRVRLEAAAALFEASRFEEAEVVYKSVLEKRPNSYRALLKLGYLARKRGDRAASLEYFEAAQAAHPRRKRAKLGAAMELRKLSRLDEAEALYRSILADDPNQSRALTGLGRIARARLAKSEKREKSGLPPFERSWLERDAFARADEWGRHMEALGIPAYGMSLLTLAQDFAYGATEEVRQDCIVVRRNGKTKILPLVSDWNEYDRILKREAAILPPDGLLGQVPERREGWTHDFRIVESHREFVFHRESVLHMTGSSLSVYRKDVRHLLKAGVQVEPIGPANMARVLACNDRWFAGKRERGRKTYFRGRTLWTFENLQPLEALGVRHLAVMLDGDAIGYGVGSRLGASWAAFVYGRGDREPRGVSSYIQRELSRLYPEYQWINAGPAVRKPELAWFKERFTTNASEKQMTMGWIRV